MLVRPSAQSRVVAELPIALVLIVLVLGLALTYLHHFRLGCFVVGFAVLLAAGLRATLSARRAGLLVVRSRALDVSVLTVLAIAVLVLTAVVPPLRP